MTLEFVRFQALGLDVDLHGIVWGCPQDSRKFVDLGLLIWTLARER